MKKNLPTIILSILLLVSIVGNIALFSSLSKEKSINKNLQTTLDTANKTIVSLREKNADLERQVTDKEGEIKKLEDMVVALTTPTPTPEVTDPQDEIGNGAGQQLTESETTYLEEAKDLWAQNKDSFECNEETFTEAYIGLRDSEKSKEEAYSEVLDTFVKEEESQPVVTPAPQPQPEPETQPQPEPTQKPQQAQQPQQSQPSNKIPTYPGENEGLDNSGIGTGLEHTGDYGSFE